MADGDHFSMGRRIEIAAHRVARFGYNFIAQRDDRSDRDLAGLGGNSGKVERSAHRRGQRKSHDRPTATPPRRACHARKARRHMSAGGVLLLLGPPNFDGRDFNPLLVALHLDLRDRDIGLTTADFDRPGLHFERRRLAALGANRAVARRHIGRTGASRLGNIDETRGDSRDQRNHHQDQNEQDSAHILSPSRPRDVGW
jgi:hypothetical protein